MSSFASEVSSKQSKRIGTPLTDKTKQDFVITQGIRLYV